MSALAIRRAARRIRHHPAALLAVLVIGGAVAFHHNGIGVADVHHADGMGEAVELCLGVFAAAGAAVAVVALGLVALGRWRPPIVLSAEGLSRLAVVPQPRARAGPAFLSLLCVSRR